MKETELIEFSHHHPIIIFDGECILCNGFIDFIIKKDKARVFRYKTLQSNTIETVKNDSDDTVYLYDKGVLYKYSYVAIKISSYLPAPYKYFGLIRIVPVSIRNYSYKLIAKYRHRIFGKKSDCMVPTEDIKELFCKKAI